LFLDVEENKYYKYICGTWILVFLWLNDPDPVCEEVISDATGFNIQLLFNTGFLPLKKK